MRVKAARLRYTAAWLLLSIGALFSTVAHAGAGVWTSGGPYGGNVRALAFDPVNPTTLYAGTDRGVFRSPISGGTWDRRQGGIVRTADDSLNRVSIPGNRSCDPFDALRRDSRRGPQVHRRR